MNKIILFFVALIKPSAALAQTATEGVQNITAEQIEKGKEIFDMIVEFFVKYGFQVLGEEESCEANSPCIPRVCLPSLCSDLQFSFPGRA